jgi:hypothetical protein
MDDGLQIRKIIIDSRTATVGTGQEWEIMLPETLSIPHGYGCYVTDVALSHSWRTVHGTSSVGARNHILFFTERLWFPGGPEDFTVLNRCVLTPGSYGPVELANEIETQMNANTFFGAGAYTVTYSSLVHTIYVSLAFAGDATYPHYHGFQLCSAKVLSDATFRAYAGGGRLLYNNSGVAFPNSSPTAYTLDWSHLEEASGLLGLDADLSVGVAGAAMNTLISNTATSYQWPTTYATGTVDVRHVETVYIHSNALSNFSTIGPAGSRTCLVRIPVNGLAGSVLVKQHSGNAHDYQDCGGKMLRVLDFSIRNSHNEIIDMHGGHCSFELVFAPVPNS